jgi:hypothetical protein
MLMPERSIPAEVSKMQCTRRVSMCGSGTVCDHVVGCVACGILCDPIGHVAGCVVMYGLGLYVTMWLAVWLVGSCVIL